MNELCDILEIDKTRSTAFNPASDGQCERQTRTIADMICKTLTVDEEHNKMYDDWDLKLPFVMMAYRASVHDTTGETPNMANLGRQTSMPLDVITDRDPQVSYETPSHYVRALEDDIRRCHLRVREATARAALREKRHYDKDSKLERFHKGDLVLVKSFLRQKGCGKFMDRYFGPFVVVHRLSDIHYRVQESPTARPQVVHLNRLRRYYARTPDQNDTDWVHNVQIRRPRRMRRHTRRSLPAAADELGENEQQNDLIDYTEQRPTENSVADAGQASTTRKKRGRKTRTKSSPVLTDVINSQAVEVQSAPSAMVTQDTTNLPTVGQNPEVQRFPRKRVKVKFVNPSEVADIIKPIKAKRMRMNKSCDLLDTGSQVESGAILNNPAHASPPVRDSEPQDPHTESIEEQLPLHACLNTGNNDISLLQPRPQRSRRKPKRLGIN